jgi:IS1 family transposase
MNWCHSKITEFGSSDLCKKKESSGSTEDLERQYGRTWVWTAIDAQTRLLITFCIGGRELGDARQMLKDQTDRCQGKPLFVSDELTHYGTVLGELFHQLAPLSPTGKPGRPRNPKRVIDADLDCATVHKTRQGSQIIKVEGKVIHGTEPHIFARSAESPSQTINTAYIEGSNLDRRLWDAHLTRKTPTVARSMRWLKAKFAICVASYNLIRPHERLSRGEDLIFRPKTPVMAANVADHPWTFSEFLAHPALCQ